MSLALTQDSLEIVRLLCDVTLRMIEGELYQLTKNGDIAITRGRALRHHPPQDRVPVRRLARRSAACSGTRRPSSERALREYGFNLGIAFQLMDDLLDFTGDAAALGKPVGGDLREGKLTLPVIRLLESRRRAAPARSSPTSSASAPSRSRRWAEICAAARRQSSALDFASRARERVRAKPPATTSARFPPAPSATRSRRWRITC